MREAALANQNSALTSALEHLLASGGKRVRPAVALLSFSTPTPAARWPWRQRLKCCTLPPWCMTI